MRKISVFIVLLTLVSLCGCNNPDVSHIHTFANEYTYDENYHWKELTCGHDEEVDKQPHIMEEITDINGNVICLKCQECLYSEQNNLNESASITIGSTTYSESNLNTCAIDGLEIKFEDKAFHLTLEKDVMINPIKTTSDLIIDGNGELSINCNTQQDGIDAMKMIVNDVNISLSLNQTNTKSAIVCYQGEFNNTTIDINGFDYGIYIKSDIHVKNSILNINVNSVGVFSYLSASISLISSTVNSNKDAIQIDNLIIHGNSNIFVQYGNGVSLRNLLISKDSTLNIEQKYKNEAGYYQRNFAAFSLTDLGAFSINGLCTVKHFDVSIKNRDWVKLFIQEYGEFKTICCNDENSRHENIVIDKAIEPGYFQQGLTEGSHCGSCGQVIVAQKEIGTLEGDIKYKDATFTEEGRIWYEKDGIEVDGTSKVLPKLNLIDYSYSEDNEKMIFTLKESGIDYVVETNYVEFVSIGKIIYTKDDALNTINLHSSSLNLENTVDLIYQSDKFIISVDDETLFQFETIFTNSDLDITGNGEFLIHGNRDVDYFMSANYGTLNVNNVNLSFEFDTTSDDTNSDNLIDVINNGIKAKQLTVNDANIVLNGINNGISISEELIFNNVKIDSNSTNSAILGLRENTKMSLSNVMITSEGNCISEVNKLTLENVNLEGLTQRAISKANEVNLNGTNTIKAKNSTIKEVKVLNIHGKTDIISINSQAINADEINLSAEVNIFVSNSDAIIVNSTMVLNSNLHIVNSEEYTSTAINLNASTLIINNTANVVIENFYYGIGSWTNGKIEWCDNVDWSSGIPLIDNRPLVTMINCSHGYANV